MTNYHNKIQSKKKTKILRMSFLVILILDWFTFLASTIIGWYAFHKLKLKFNLDFIMEGNQYLVSSKMLLLTSSIVSLIGVLFIPILIGFSRCKFRTSSSHFIRSKGGPFTGFWSILMTGLSLLSLIVMTIIAIKSKNLCDSFQKNTERLDISSCPNLFMNSLIKSSFVCYLVGNSILLLTAIISFIFPFKDQEIIDDSFRYSSRNLRQIPSIASSLRTNVDYSISSPTKYHANLLSFNSQSQFNNDDDDNDKLLEIQYQTQYRRPNELHRVYSVHCHHPSTSTSTSSTSSPPRIPTKSNIRTQRSLSSVKRKQIRSRDYPSTTTINTFFDAQSSNDGHNVFKHKQNHSLTPSMSPSSSSSSISEISTPKRTSSLLYSSSTNYSRPQRKIKIDHDIEMNDLTFHLHSDSQPPTYIFPVPSYQS